MSIDRLETLRSIEGSGEGKYNMHVIWPDGRNESFEGVPLVRLYQDKALIIEESSGENRQRILRLIRVLDPKLVEVVDQYASAQKLPPMVVRI